MKGHLCLWPPGTVTGCRNAGRGELIMLVYLLGVGFVSAALGACFAFVGGLIVLMLLIIAVTGALIYFSVSSGLSALATVAVCFLAIVFLNLGWFGAVLVVGLRSFLVFVREHLFLGTDGP